MRRGDIRQICVDGQKLDASFLGRGRYCCAWRIGERVYIFIDQDNPCYMKEAVSEFCDKMPHLPEVERHEDACERGKDFYVYSMPYYRNVTATDKEAWGMFRELQRANEEARQEILFGLQVDAYPGAQKRSLASHGYEIARRTIELAEVPKALKEALKELSDAGANYGSGVTFEFSKRNVGVDAEGRLILRDVIFDAEQLKRERRKEAKRRQRRAVYAW